MSIWSDLQDRSAREMMRREDMQKIINDLTEEIKQLQAVNKKLSEQLKDYNRYFHKSPTVWYSDWNNDTHEGMGSIYKF